MLAELALNSSKTQAQPVYLMGTMCLCYSVCIAAGHLWANYDNMGTSIHYPVQGEKRLCKELRDRHLKSRVRLLTTPRHAIRTSSHRCAMVRTYGIGCRHAEVHTVLPALSFHRECEGGTKSVQTADAPKCGRPPTGCCSGAYWTCMQYTIFGYLYENHHTTGADSQGSHCSASCASRT